jgi:hypothetical protein
VTGSTASGSCAVEEIVVGSSDLRSGGKIKLIVDWMTKTCEDTGGTNQPAEDMDVAVTPTASPKSRHLGMIRNATGPRLPAAGTSPLPASILAGDAVLTVTSFAGEGL